MYQIACFTYVKFVVCQSYLKKLEEYLLTCFFLFFLIFSNLLAEATKCIGNKVILEYLPFLPSHVSSPEFPITVNYSRFYLFKLPNSYLCLIIQFPPFHTKYTRISDQFYVLVILQIYPDYNCFPSSLLSTLWFTPPSLFTLTNTTTLSWISLLRLLSFDNDSYTVDSDLFKNANQVMLF